MSFSDRCITVRSLGQQLARFRVIGRRSQAVLSRVLTAVSGCPSTGVWTALAALQSPACLPPSAVLSLSVYDPRMSAQRALHPDVAPHGGRGAVQAPLTVDRLCANWPCDVASRHMAVLWDDGALGDEAAALYVD